MQYLELISGETTICFNNDWTGVETVEVNGQLYSKKSSVYGAQHYFVITENGKQVNYTLISKVAADYVSVLVDLFKEGKPIYENIPLPYGSKPKSPALIAKQEGLKRLKMYDIDAAIDEFKKALKTAPDDPEIFFNLACAYSNKEKAEDGFKCLRTAIDKGLKDTDNIFSHDMLAYLRVHPGFKEIKLILDKTD